MSAGQHYLIQKLHHTLLCDFAEKSQHVCMCSPEGAFHWHWQLDQEKKD